MRHTNTSLGPRCQNSDCHILTETYGTNGSRWFIKNLSKIISSPEIGMSSRSPVTITTDQAAKIINIALDSGHYMREEFDTHLENPNWKPQRLTKFLCYFLEHAKWMGFLWIKLQTLRLSYVWHRAGKWPDTKPEITLDRLGIEKISAAAPKIISTANASVAEFGVANRFWLIRKAAIPGLGWAACFLFLISTVWPISQIYLSDDFLKVSFSFVYGIGLMALLASLNFTLILIMGKKTAPPFDHANSIPPSGQ